MLIESAAALAVFNSLDASQDYGDAAPAQITQARGQLQAFANAVALCIPHLLTGIVSTSVTATVSGAVTGPPPTVGAVSGSATGTIGGLSKPVLQAAILAQLVADSPAHDPAQLDALADAIAEFAPYVMANAQVSTTDAGTAITPGVNGPTNGTGTGTIA